MNKHVLATLKNPLLFVGSIIGAILCLGLAIYYAVPVGSTMCPWAIPILPWARNWTIWQPFWSSR